MEISLSTLMTGMLSAVLAGAAVFGLIGQRTKEISATYKGLYEAKVAENNEQDARITTLEAQVNLLTSNFVQDIARGVSQAFIEIMREEDARGERHGQ